MMGRCGNRNFRCVVLLVSVVFLAGSLCGCTSLRRKFVRKSKTEDKKDLVAPVLRPEEYAPRAYSPKERYSEHYAVLKGYWGDLWSTLGRDEGGKREKYLLTQVESKIQAMSDLLQEGDKRDGLRRLAEEVGQSMRELNKARPMRRYDIVGSDLRRVERDLRRQYKPDMVAGTFK